MSGPRPRTGSVRTVSRSCVRLGSRCVLPPEPLEQAPEAILVLLTVRADVNTSHDLGEALRGGLKDIGFGSLHVRIDQVNDLVRLEERAQADRSDALDAPFSSVAPAPSEGPEPASSRRRVHGASILYPFPYQSAGSPTWNQTSPSAVATAASCSSVFEESTSVVGQVALHPLEMRRFGLDTDDEVIATGVASRHRPVGQPLAPARAELDHPKPVVRCDHALEEIDPLEVVLVLDRRRGLERSSGREVREPLEHREVCNSGLYAEKIDVPARLDRSLPGREKTRTQGGARLQDLPRARARAQTASLCRPLRRGSLDRSADQADVCCSQLPIRCLGSRRRP